METISQGTIDASTKPERIREQHFDYTLVFGQGPVQDAQGIPKSGREGLNFFSRLIALAAAQMLKDGITDAVILSGGKTGDGQTASEADLMADVIRRRLRQATWDNKIHIEDQAHDTLQNFAFILNKYIDKDRSKNPTMALLGIGFHAKDTYNGTGQGRLEVLASIFRVPGKVYGAEDVLRELVIGSRSQRSAVANELDKLTQVAERHTISILKSQQEKLLIEYLAKGDWVLALPLIESEQRVRSMIVHDPCVISQFGSVGFTAQHVQTMSRSDLIDTAGKMQFEGRAREGYHAVKKAVLDAFDAMTKKEGINYYGKYAK